MTEAELAGILRRMYRNAPIGEQSTSLHIFGIRYVAELSAPHVSINPDGRTFRCGKELLHRSS